MTPECRTRATQRSLLARKKLWFISAHSSALYCVLDLAIFTWAVSFRRLDTTYSLVRPSLFSLSEVKQALLRICVQATCDFRRVGNLGAVSKSNLRVLRAASTTVPQFLHSFKCARISWPTLGTSLPSKYSQINRSVSLQVIALTGDRESGRVTVQY